MSSAEVAAEVQEPPKKRRRFFVDASPSPPPEEKSNPVSGSPPFARGAFESTNTSPDARKEDERPLNSSQTGKETIKKRCPTISIPQKSTNSRRKFSSVKQQGDNERCS